MTPLDLESVKGWIYRAQKKDCRYLVIAHDSLTHQHYPLYVQEGEDFWEKVKHLHPAGMSHDPFSAFSMRDRIDEVYDLTMDVSSQLSEDRAWHAPRRLDA